MTYSLYNSPTGAHLCGSEYQGSVNVINGVYSPQMGSVVPINLPIGVQGQMT